MDNTAAQVEKLIHDLTPMITGVASKTWEVARNVEQMQAIAGVLSSLEAALFLGGLAFILRRMIAKGKSSWSDKSNVTAAYFFSWVFIGLCGVAFVFVLDPWSWITIYRPDLGLAHMLMDKALSP